MANDDPNKKLSPEEIAALFAANSSPAQVEEPKAVQTPAATVNNDPNKKLSPDEIAALFAASGNEPATKKEETSEHHLSPAEEAETLEDALKSRRGKGTSEEEVEESEEAGTDDPNDTLLGGDPNRQLTPEEIAALFGNAGGPQKTEELKEEASEKPVAAPDSDPNKKLSTDEIAALFAASNDTSVMEEPEEIEKEPEEKKEEATEKPVAAPDSDPNKKLSADEIAALFAASNDTSVMEEPEEIEKEPEEKKEEAAEKPATAPDSDPNKKLSADEIAALFAAGNDTSVMEEPAEIEEEEPKEKETKAEAKETVPETLASASDSDPNKTLSADEIAALFAAGSDTPDTEEPEKIRKEEVEEPEEKTPEDIKKEVELDLNNSDDLDVLLGIKDKDVTEIIDEMHTDDDDLAEISDLLKKSDANELVDADDMLAVLQQGMNSTENQEGETDSTESGQLPEASVPEEAEDEEESGKKRKKKKEKKVKEKKERKSIFPWKRKKEEAPPQNLMEPEGEMSQPLAPQDQEADEAFLDAFMAASEKTEEKPETETIAQQEEIPDSGQTEEAMSPDQLDQLLAKEGKDGREKEPKKKGFLSKIFSSLLEEVEEEETPPEGEAEDKAAAKKAKKEKKKKEKKGKKATDADDNGAILEEMDAEGDGKKKKKPKKEKKPKKPKEPKAPAEDDGKKLPKKPIIRIFVLSFSLMVMILLITNILPGVLALSNARKAFYQKDYLTTYQEMIGKKLNESDAIIFEKTTIILKVQRKYSAYKNFLAVGMKPQALNALLEGMSVYDKLKEEAEGYGILGEIDDIYKNITDALENTFGVSEERAREINAMDTDLAYTKAIRQILGMDAPENAAADGKQPEPAQEENAPAEETDPMEGYEDILSEELQ